MIRITSQDGLHQYDAQGRAITDWHDKKCAWIVNEEFKHEEIDWYGEDSDFPSGYQSLEAFERDNPNWAKLPDISVQWFWNDKASCIRAFGQPSSFLGWAHPNANDYWDIQKYPYTDKRRWGYLDYTREQAFDLLGKYCDLYRKADRTVVTYNGEVLFDGKLTDKSTIQYERVTRTVDETIG